MPHVAHRAAPDATPDPSTARYAMHIARCIVSRTACRQPAWTLPHQMLGGAPPMNVLASLQPAAPLYLESKQLRGAVAQEGL